MGTGDIELTLDRRGRARSVAAQRSLLYEDRLGTIAHSAIAWLLTNDLPLNERGAVRATDIVLGRQVAPVYRQSVRAWVSGAVVRYESFFSRGREWRFLGAEAIIGDVALDLVWVNSRGQFEADELKAGISAAGSISLGLAQATGQAEAAAAAFGPKFLGVRLVVLNKPEISVVVSPGGETRPVFGAAEE